jgi:hypothetical protein
MFYDQLRLGSNWNASDLPSAPLDRLQQWIERRLSPRREVNISVLVLHGSLVQSSILCDVSETGFGLSKVSNIARDDLVFMTLPDGRIREGRVVWAKDGSAGVELMSRV